MGHASESSAGTGRLAILVVCGKVEQDEESKVGADHDNTRKRGELLSRAVAGVRHPGKIFRGKVGVRGKIYEAQVDDKLYDLKTGHPLLPPNADATSTLEVVPVHNNMN